MKKILTGLGLTTITFFLFFNFSSCEKSDKEYNHHDEELNDSDSLTLIGDKHFISGYEPLLEDGKIQAVVEIPTGTLAKWEVDKETGHMFLEIKNGEPRIVQYLGYPGNYGMIPRTLLSKESGGDGDPLDVIILGPPVKRGSVVKAQLIGVLKLLDGGERDDKLIAVMEGSPFSDIQSLSELNDDFKGVSIIIQTWFENYKGPGEMESTGFGDKEEAMEILDAAIRDYQ